jgi:hypothetical protein
MLDVVASLQWAGADVVAAYQFPVSVDTPGGGGNVADLRDLLPREKSRDQLALEAEQAERRDREAAERAEEVSEAAIARAQRPAEPPSTLAALLQTPAVEPLPAMQPTLVVQEVVVSRPSIAALDEDAILAATVLLFSRRG